MKAYSQDLRERVVRAVDQGKSRDEVADLFAVSLSTMKRYVRQRRDRGHVRPKMIPGRPPTKRASFQAKLLVQLEANPDATRAASIVRCGKRMKGSRSVYPR